MLRLMDLVRKFATRCRSFSHPYDDALCPLGYSRNRLSFREVHYPTCLNVADALGVFGLFAMFLLYLAFSDDGTGREAGGRAQWFVIFSVLSLGSLPLASIALHWLQEG